MAIHFHYEHPTFNLNTPSFIQSWINNVVQSENRITGDLSFVFVTDHEMLDINKKYLNKDYFTDVITFDYSLEERISGDIFISVDTVKFNAEKYKVKFINEMKRVIIHGVLHLLGYNDISEEDKIRMKRKEDICLKLMRDEGWNN